MEAAAKSALDWYLRRMDSCLLKRRAHMGVPDFSAKKADEGQ